MKESVVRFSLIIIAVVLFPVFNYGQNLVMNEIKLESIELGKKIDIINAFLDDSIKLTELKYVKSTNRITCRFDTFNANYLNAKIRLVFSSCIDFEEIKTSGLYSIYSEDKKIGTICNIRIGDGKSVVQSKLKRTKYKLIKSNDSHIKNEKSEWSIYTDSKVGFVTLTFKGDTLFAIKSEEIVYY